MAIVYIQVCGSLQFFIKQSSTDRWIEHNYWGSPSLKHIIESLGIPHPEVANILLNGKVTNINAGVQPDGRIQIIPYTQNDEKLPRPLDEIKFIVDNHLGKLATYLRILGFDTDYKNNFQDE
jgi:hypothetical protein